MTLLDCTHWIGALLGLAALACSSGPTDGQLTSRDWIAERQRMVDEQLRARDIRDPRVLDAMLAVPRHLFVPEAGRAEAYRDSPVPIGYGQTISQPYIVAFMTQALQIQPSTGMTMLRPTRIRTHK